MYGISDLLRGVQEPKKVAREINRICHRRGGKWDYNEAGIDIFSEDWDNLIILDACRYDDFIEYSALPGETDYRISRGAATYEFIRANFAEKTLYDTVYVGANTWFLKLKDEIHAEVHEFIDLQHMDNGIQLAVSELNVPTPESVTQAAREAHISHPNKRLIVHYLQPHHPFIGEKGREWFSHQSNSLNEVIKQTPRVSGEKVREAYRENLELVLSEVEELIEVLPGRTVVTADHGEMLGDRHQYIPIRDYGHHEGIYNDALVKVPWHIFEGKERKDTTAEAPDRDHEFNDDMIDERLRDLGYRIE